MKSAPQKTTEEESNRRLARNFLEKIERDRDNEIASISSDSRERIARIHAEAHRTAREFHRRSAEQVRQRCRRESGRHYARAVARLRRESWRTLRRLQKTALADLRTRLAEMYEDPDRQWSWCLHWLLTAQSESAGHALDITLGRGIAPETRRRLEEHLRAGSSEWTLSVAEDLGYGLTIAWGNQLLDARLEAQMATVSAEVFRRLAVELHARQRNGAE